MLAHPIRKTLLASSIWGLFAAWIWTQHLVKAHGYPGRPLFWLTFIACSILCSMAVLFMSDTFVYYMIRPLAPYFLPKRFPEHYFLFARARYREFAKGKVPPHTFVDSLFVNVGTNEKMLASVCSFLAMMEFDKQAILDRFRAPSESTIRDAVESAYAKDPWRMVHFVSALVSMVLLLVVVLFPAEFAKWVWAGPVAFLASRFIQ